MKLYLSYLLTITMVERQLSFDSNFKKYILDTMWPKNNVNRSWMTNYKDFKRFILLYKILAVKPITILIFDQVFEIFKYQVTKSDHVAFINNAKYVNKHDGW